MPILIDNGNHPVQLLYPGGIKFASYATHNAVTIRRFSFTDGFLPGDYVLQGGQANLFVPWDEIKGLDFVFVVAVDEVAEFLISKSSFRPFTGASEEDYIRMMSDSIYLNGRGYDAFYAPQIEQQFVCITIFKI